jgi:hypothetical protein
VRGEAPVTAANLLSFLVDPTKERWSMGLIKPQRLPWLYWKRMLKGLPHESRELRAFAKLVHAFLLDERVPRPGRLEAAAEAGSC